MRIRLAACIVVAAFLSAGVDASAQYRKNDEFHAGHQKFDDPARTSPNRSAEIEFGSGHATIEWGAPSVRDREVYGRLVPEGSVWRAGANEATVIHFDDDVRVEGEPLDAGSYALFSIGSPDEWTFIFNTVSQQWGAFSHDSERDALRVTVSPGEGVHQEELQFSFVDTDENSITVRMRWGTVSVDFDVALANGGRP
jgi:hypothetical protein